MTINRLLNQIRESRRRAKKFDSLTTEQKRDFIASCDGSDWHLDDILDDFVDMCRREKRRRK